MTGGYWLVANTKPQRELWAAENVQRQGFTHYLPRIVASRADKSRTSFLFPRYLFVYTEGPWRCLLSTFGIAGLVMAGESPAVLPDREIERIKRRENAEGIVKLAEAPVERFKRGDRVRVTEGVFSGYQGVYEHQTDQERVRVLIDYLGRATPVLIGGDLLEPA